MSKSISLSVLVPVYNEQHLVYASLQRLKCLEDSPILGRVEVIVVDDCSTDDTPRVLAQFRLEHADSRESKIHWTFLRHSQNQGKGAAVRTALEHATCDVSVIPSTGSSARINTACGTPSAAVTTFIQFQNP